MERDISWFYSDDGREEHREFLDFASYGRAGEGTGAVMGTFTFASTAGALAAYEIIANWRVVDTENWYQGGHSAADGFRHFTFDWLPWRFEKEGRDPPDTPPSRVYGPLDATRQPRIWPRTQEVEDRLWSQRIAKPWPRQGWVAGELWSWWDESRYGKGSSRDGRPQAADATDAGFRTRGVRETWL